MRSAALRRGVGVAVLAAIGGAAIYFVVRPEVPGPITGVVRATELRVAPEVGGHLAAIHVGKGGKVKAGDVVAELAALELTASVEQARAAYQSAVAARNNVFAGVRAEEIAVSAAEVSKAQSRLGYAEQQFGRFTRLGRDNYVSGQAVDQAEMQVATARADIAEAAANHATATAGPTREERAIAEARVAAVAAQIAVLESRLRKTVLKAPADGIVRVIAGEVGEAVRAGQTIITIEAAAQPWVSFNVREDRLAGVTIGTSVNVILAGASAPVPGHVTELTPIGQFATWQAERAVGDHDRNTLRLRVDPDRDLANFEPGMTVWLVR